MLNKLLAQQVQKYFGDPEKLSAEADAFVNAVSGSYDHLDEKIKLLESSVAEYADKLNRLNEKLLNETEELKDAHNELSRIFNQVNEGFFTRDILTQKYIGMSVGCEKIYGYSIESFFENSGLWYEVIHPDDRKIIDADNLILTKGVQIKTSYRIIRKDNTTRWIEVKAIPVIADGKLVRVDGVVNDITEQKEAELKIIDSERGYRSLFEQNLAGIYQTTISGKMLTCNQAFAHMLGYASPQELMHTNMVDLYYTKKDRDDFIAALKDHKKLYNYEIILKQKNGNPLHIIENISLFTDLMTGEEICEGIMLDITERKKGEVLLKQSEERYRQILETAQEGIWMIDDNNDTTFINKKMCEIIGYSPAEIMGKKIQLFMDADANKTAKEQVERRKRGISETYDAKFITKGGRVIDASISVNPVFDDTGIYKGALSMVTDITKRKLNEELLQKSEAILDLKNKELQRKNKELEEFAYVASHDLQEPVRTINSFVLLLNRQYAGRIDEKADKYLHFIVDSSNRMKTLINDLLDYSRIGGKHEMERVACNKILRDVIADLYKAINDSSAEIILDDLPVIKGYPTELKQLFQNLVINAIKFRKENVSPQIKVSVERAGNYWHFTVADNGIGIASLHLERIFVIFQRLHTHSEYPGSGIGLSHCKKIVELHHGKIWVESVQGEGSTFHFTILEYDHI